MRSRFKGSKRVRKSGSFEKMQTQIKHFVQNIDKIAIVKTGICFILLIILYFLSTTVYGSYVMKSTYEESMEKFTRFK